MSFITFKIYGSNTNVSSNEKTAIEALADLQTFEIPLRVVNANPEIEIDTIEYFGGSTTSYKTVKIKLNPESLAIKYPSASTSFNTYFGLDCILKKYLWVDLKDYKITLHDSTHLFPCALEGYEIEHDAEKGAKRFNINLVG